MAERKRAVWKIWSLPMLGLIILVPSADGTGGTPLLTLASRGKSDYQIVVPDASANQTIERRLWDAGELIRNVFEHAGCDVLVRGEHDRDPSKPAIFLGNTAFARAHGVDLGGLQGWGYVHKVVGRNVILAGRDEPPAATRGTANRVATEKAVADFLRTYAGTRFLYPPTGPKDETSIEFADVARIAVPSDLDIVKTPMLRVNHTHRVQQSLYHIANNLFPRIDLFGAAHTYGEAIPMNQYRETHPEYFALIDGQRACCVKNYRDEWTQHYCISNPEVGNLLYEYLLAMFDEGFDTVVLGPMDAFQKCQCEECETLYDTDDWGEKLWLFHRSLCLRLLESRPKKKVLTLAYTVTEGPPKTFTRFPENMMVQMCGTNEREWLTWDGIEVPAGCTAFIYNWGIYHCAGSYTPKRTPKHIEQQAKRFAQHAVVGIYRDGFGELFGLEGPVYYTFGRMYDDPEHLTSEELLDEFCSAAFGAAKEPALRFYNRLYAGLEYYSDEVGIHCVNWGSSTRDSFLMLHTLYTPELINALEQDLNNAEAAADCENARRRLGLVRWEFSYLKSLARVVNLYYLHKDCPEDRALMAELLAAIDTRNAEIEFTCDRDRRRQLDKDNGWSTRLFPPPGCGVDELQLKRNHYRSRFKDTAVNWDTAAMRSQAGLSSPVLRPGGTTEPIGDF